MDFTVRQKAALRALVLIVGILTMMHMLSPRQACAAPSFDGLEAGAYSAATAWGLR